MSEGDLIVTEQRGANGEVISFVDHGNQILPLKLEKSRFFRKIRKFFNTFEDVIRPRGYPDSVSEDYLKYQIWNTLQSFCNTVSASFKTRTVLKSVGVGDGNANALSAAIIWILRDGTGMIGRILFAWWKGNIMSDVALIISEQCGSTGDIVSFVKNTNEIIQIKPRRNFIYKLLGVYSFLREVILPNGYPDSVSNDYLEYQIWDTCQAFCSTIIGAFKTRAVLKGVGVGDSTASALSAAITWILRDGTGMFGRILFAWWKGSGLDCDCKKWRYFADILNDAAMLVELCLPFYASISMQVLCVTSTMYAIVGISGGATRASITHHQAIRDNMAEISAKDGTQETIVNLIGSFGSIFLLNYFSSSRAEWILIISLMVLHLYTNFLAVKALIFNTFNRERLALVLKSYFTIGSVLNPAKVNLNESVLLGFGLNVKRMCGFDIVLGESIKKSLSEYAAADIKLLQSVYEDKKYMLLVSGTKKKIYVCLEKGETAADVISGYFHAVCLGIATSIYNSLDLDIYARRQLHHPTPITRLYTYMKSYEKSHNHYRNIPPNYLMEFNEFVRQEHSMFFTALDIQGWNIDSHSLEVSEFRIDWKSSQSKKTI